MRGNKIVYKIMRGISRVDSQNYFSQGGISNIRGHNYKSEMGKCLMERVGEGADRRQKVSQRPSNLLTFQKSLVGNGGTF